MLRSRVMASFAYFEGLVAFSDSCVASNPRRLKYVRHGFEANSCVANFLGITSSYASRCI